MNVSLILQRKDGAEKAFPMRDKAVILGRRPDCDLCIPLQVISRRHCQLSIEQETLKIRDLKSSNGTFVNGKKIHSETVVRTGDRLKLGPLTFKVKTDRPSAPPPTLDSGMEDTNAAAYQASGDQMNRNGSI